MSRATGEKPKTGLYIGIAAGIAVIGGAAFLFSGGKPTNDANSGGADNAGSHNQRLVTSSPATSGPIKVVEPPKPPIAKSDLKPVPPTGTTNSGGWINGLAEWLAVPGNAAKGTLKQEGAVWRWVGPEAVFLGGNPAGKSLANLAVRLTFRHGGRNSVAIKLRIGKTTGFNYNAVIRPDGMTEIKRWQDERDSLLAKFDPLPGFDPNASHVMEFRAQGDVLTLLVDGQTRGSVKDATLASGSFSISFGLIEKIEYRDLGSAPAAPVVAGAGSDGWIDGLAEWLAKPENAAQRTLQKEGAAWRYKGPQAIGLGARLSPPNTLANVAVRYSVRLDNKNSSANIILRTQKAAGSFYQVTFYGSGSALMSLSKDRQLTRLASYPIPAGFDETAAHAIEFRAEGDKLTLLVDGVERDSVNDSTYASGGFSVTGGLIEKIEYRDLGSASAAPVRAGAGGDGWTDGLAEWLAVPGNVNTGVLTQEARGWRVAKGESINLAASQSGKRGKALANLAVRVTAPTPASFLTINLRGQQPLGYSATLLKDGKSHISEAKDGQSLRPFENGEFARSPDFDPAGRHVMEFRAEGEVLTLIIDGRTVGTIQDASLSNGNFSVHGSVGSVIEKVEYRELPALPAAAAPSVPKESAAATVPAAPVAPPAAPPAAAPANPKLAALLSDYTKAITNGLAAAAATDKPAFEAELARLKNNTPLPDAAEDAKLPAELKRLRGILREQLK